MLTVLAVIATLQTPAPTQAFYDYISHKDPSVAIQVGKTVDRETRIDLTSQTWQGIPWKHVVQVIEPSNVEFKGMAILHITGGTPNPKETAEFRVFAEMTGMPIAALYGIPIQPLWGMYEDDLIAHTFEKYLETGDSSWPLLFPMTKSALRAMDAVQKASKGTSNPIHKFVVTGASKRGWTTWFVGASGDKRVVGIAPLVIDNLNVNKQMAHQMSSWGKFSEQIEDYTRRGLQQKVSSEPRGLVLSQMIDPYTYRGRVKVPTMIINGGNDRYWTVDALSQYWDDLKQPKWVSIVPNAGHRLENRYVAIEPLVGFARSMAGEFKMPKMQWKMDEERENGGRTVIVQMGTEGTPVQGFGVWMASSDTLDFRESKWTKEAVLTYNGGTTTTKSGPVVRALLPQGKNVAVMAEFRYQVGKKEFSLNSPVQVFKK